MDDSYTVVCVDCQSEVSITILESDEPEIKFCPCCGSELEE